MRHSDNTSYLGNTSYSELRYVKLPVFDETVERGKAAAMRYLDFAEYSAEGLILMHQPSLRGAYNPDMQYRNGLGGAFQYLKGFRLYAKEGSVPEEDVLSTAQRVYGIILENLFLPVVERFGANSYWAERARRLASEIEAAVGRPLHLNPRGDELERVVAFACLRGSPVHVVQQ